MDRDSSIAISLTASPISGNTEEFEPLWDSSECLRELDCEADAEILRDVMAAFMDDSRERIEELRQAARRGHTTELREQVHSLKGSSNQVGAKRMAILCKRMEQCCGAGLSGELVVLLDQLEAIFHSTCQAILSQLDAATSVGELVE
jgi:HPt (histidine-containing phosphotransfer) domain-containing protein